MQGILKTTRLGAAVIAAATLSACANLAAVRDFTQQSSSLAGYVDTTDFVVSNPSRLLSDVPADATFKDERDRLKAAIVDRERSHASLLAIHGVVTGYMAALASLAGDKAFSVSGGLSKVQGALTASTTFDIKPATVDAYASLVTLGTDWIAEIVQEKEVKAMVARHGAAMDQMLSGLVDVSTSIVAILEEDQKRAIAHGSYYEGGFRFDLGPEAPPPANLGAAERARYEDQMATARIRRDAARILVQRSNAASLQEQHAALDSARAALAGALAVQQGHAELRRNVGHLTDAQVTARLQQLAADLQAARSNLKLL